MSADLTVPPPMQSDVEIAKLHAQHMLAPRNLDFYRFAYAIADARDAIWSERIAVRMLPAFLEEFQIDYVGLVRAIDAATQEKK